MQFPANPTIKTFSVKLRLPNGGEVNIEIIDPQKASNINTLLKEINANAINGNKLGKVSLDLEGYYIAEFSGNEYSL